MLNIILQFLFQKSFVTELILLCFCTVSGACSAFIPRTKDKMLGKIYGEEKHLRVFVKDILTVLWVVFHSYLRYCIRYRASYIMESI